MAGSAKNPYRHSRLESEYGVPDPGPVQETNAYTASQERAPYGIPGTPYVNGLSVGANGTPDDERIGIRDGADFRVNPSKPRSLWQRLFQDRRIRESVGIFFGNMPEQKEDAGQSGQRWVRRAGETPPPEPRITAQLSPHNFGYIRPADAMTGGTPRRFTGIHGSLANYDRMGDQTQYGMAPAHKLRSTYIRNLVPWGENNVDMSDSGVDYTSDIQEGTTDYIGGIPARGRSYRLA